MCRLNLIAKPVTSHSFGPPTEYDHAAGGRGVVAEASDASRLPSLRFCAPSAFPRMGRRRFERVSHPRSPAASGFLNLLPLCSAPYLPALFRAGSALGVCPSGLCSSCEAARCFQRRFPLDVGLPGISVASTAASIRRSEYQPPMTLAHGSQTVLAFRALLRTRVHHLGQAV